MFKANESRVFLFTPQGSHPRFHRRAGAFIRAGFKVTAFTFERKFYKNNQFPPGVDVVSLGCLSDGQYVRRIPSLLAVVPKIRKYLKTCSEPAWIAYGFGLDMISLALLVTQKRSKTIFLYEIGDLRNTNPGRSLFSRAVMGVEKRILRKIDLFMVTSPGFISDFYETIVPGISTKSYVIENKVSPELMAVFPRGNPTKTNGRIRLGFVGRIRFEGILRTIMQAVANRGDRYEFHVYGDGPGKTLIEQFSATCENICYHGSFRNPDDLERIYNSIDLNWVVYDNSNINVSVALPNKLYESGYFAKGMVVAGGTLLAEYVKDWKSGFIVDTTKPNFAESFLDALTTAEVENISLNAARLPDSLLVEDSGAFIDEILSRHAQ